MDVNSCMKKERPNMNWLEDQNREVTAKIQAAGNHVIVVPAQDPTARIDTYDLFDGSTQSYIATGVPEKAANEFATIWNQLLDNGESVAALRQMPLDWLTSVPLERPVYGR